MAQLNVELPDHLHRSLKIEAYSQGLTLKDYVLKLLTENMLHLQVKAATSRQKSSK